LLTGALVGRGLGWGEFVFMQVTCQKAIAKVLKKLR
jgi:hypothetical protein